MKKYDVIYSLGTNCANAIYLRDSGLRLCAGPFDWLCNAPLQKRLEIIAERFETFLLAEDLRLLIRGADKKFNKEVDSYINQRNDFHYYHDFEARLDFIKAFAKVKEKYDRRVKRFLCDLDSKNVLLLWLGEEKDIFEEKEAISQSLKIARQYKGMIDFMFVVNDERKSFEESEEYQPHSQVRVCKIHINGQDKEGNVLDLGLCGGNRAMIEKIYKTIALKEKYYLLLQKKLWNIMIVGLRLLSCLVPNKSWRKKMRNLVRV